MAMRSMLVVAVLGASVAAMASVPTGASLEVDFASHLARHDLTWQWDAQAEEKPDLWYESAFVGNGMLGAYMFEPNDRDATEQYWRAEVSRMDVYDDRTGGHGYTGNFVYDEPRLPIGFLRLSMGKAGISAATMRMSLFRGETTANISLPSGCEVSLVMLANADFVRGPDVLAWSLSWDASSCGAAPPVGASFVPEVAESTWASKSSSYVHNPNVTVASAPLPPGVQGGVDTFTQLHLKGTAHATAFATVDAGPGRLELFVAVSPVLGSAAAATANATAAASAAASAGFAAVRASNMRWWAAFWPRGAFLTSNATWINSFWSAQWFKFASASRAERGLMMDLEGPWFVPGTPWPDVHHDMNAQMQHYAPLTANRLELFQPYVDTWLRALVSGALAGNIPRAWINGSYPSAAAPTGASSFSMRETCYWDYGPNCTTSPPSITGNLLWLTQLIDRRVALAPDDGTAASALFPLLRAAVNFYAGFELPGPSQPDGRTHLPETFSPEYPYRGPDTNYDLQLYHWGLGRVIELAEAGKGKPTAGELARWRARLADLAPFPVDENGFMIAAGVPLNVSHRHFSHLMAIWPLRTIDFSDPAALALSERSVDHWVGMKGALTGFCRPAMSQMSLQFGRRSATLSNITFLLRDWIKPNTFYTEGPDGPCTETPYAASYALQGAYVTSFNGTIRVFQGIDDGMAPAAAFYGLRAEGAFLVSGRRRDNQTHFVAVVSEAGGDFVVETDMAAPWAASSNASSAVALTSLAPVAPAFLPRYRVSGLPAGASVMLYRTGAPPTEADAAIGPAPGCEADANFWGVKPSAAAGVPAQLAPCGNGSSPSSSQAFDLVDVPGTGAFEIRQRGSSSPPRCVGTASCGTSDGTGIVLIPCGAGGAGSGCSSDGCNGANTLWQWTSSPFPDRLRQPYASSQHGSDMCMDVPGALGPKLDLYTCDNHVGQLLNQEWTYNKVTGALETQCLSPGWVGTCLTAGA